MVKLQSVANLDLRRLYALARKYRARFPEDVVHDAYESLLEANLEYNDDLHAKRTLTQKVVWLSLRPPPKKKVRIAGDLELAAEVLSPIDIERDLRASDLASSIHGTLSGKLRAVFGASVSDFGSCEEMASDLGMSVNSFKVTLSSLRKLLKSEFAS